MRPAAQCRQPTHPPRTANRTSSSKDCDHQMADFHDDVIEFYRWIEGIKDRVDRASEGPWMLEDSVPSEAVPVVQAMGSMKRIGSVTVLADASFIASARVDVPTLAAMVERHDKALRLALDALRRLANDGSGTALEAFGEVYELMGWETEPGDLV